MDRLIKRAGKGSQKKLEKKTQKEKGGEKKGGRKAEEGGELKRWRSGDRSSHPWSCPFYAFRGKLPVPGAAPEDLGMPFSGHPGGSKGTGRSATKDAPQDKLHARFQQKNPWIELTYSAFFSLYLPVFPTQALILTLTMHSSGLQEASCLSFSSLL